MVSTMVIPNDQRNGYLETTGRRSGQPRETEIWYFADGDRIFLLSGYHNNKDWVKNFLANPRVRFRIGARWFAGTARFLDDDPQREDDVRHMLVKKYYNADELNEWGRSGSIVEIAIGENGM
jgi:deazaflavin-dependent oxidoreductase (nitroreductase family)